jgi:hypothetical protein
MIFPHPLLFGKSRQCKLEQPHLELENTNLLALLSIIEHASGGVIGAVEGGRLVEYGGMGGEEAVVGIVIDPVEVLEGY